MNVEKILHNKRLMKYFFVAVSVVSIELIAFQLIYLVSRHYLAATILSFILAVVLNWILGRKVVFGASHYTKTREFMLVLVASVVGLAIQTSIVILSVEILKLYPLIGKVVSIMFSFFWNYWFRSAYIYRSTK